MSGPHDRAVGPAARHAFRCRRPSRPETPHVVACTCYRGLPLLRSGAIRDRLAECIESARQGFQMQIDSWVILPGAARLLLMPRSAHPGALRAFMASFKRDFAQQMVARWRDRNAAVLRQLLDIRGRVRIWQTSPEWDREVRSEAEIAERRAEIHSAPVVSGLVSSPADWAWSTARWYQGERAGVIAVEPL